MTNQELNEAVARKLGKIQLDDIGQITMGSIEDYSTSIEAAWEIVELLTTTKLVALVMGVPGKWLFTIEGYKFDHLPIADTAPMAICLAFLKLGEGK